MFASGRSRGASAIRMTLIRGNGLADFIPAVIPANVQMTPPRRADFERAWAVFLSKRTEADFQKWRDNRDWTARKYAMWEAGERFPSQKPSSLMKCPSGETFDSHRLEHTMVHVPHITEAQRTQQTRRCC
jgi:hypothetical protein